MMITARNNFKNLIQQSYSEKVNKIYNEICQSKITENNKEDVCLIGNDLIKDIFDNRNYFNSNNVYFSSKKCPKIINNLTKEIKGKFGIILKETFQLLYNDYDNTNKELYNNEYYEIYKIVNEPKTFNYYAGYNKLLIISKDHQALLILNPIDSIINLNNYVIGIIINSMKDPNKNPELYKQIISNELDLNNNNPNLNNNIILDDSEERFIKEENIKKIFEKVKEYKENIILKNNNMMKIFVNLYYYENILKSKKNENPFVEYQYYYIINNNWLNKFKSSNNYDKICNALKRYDEKNNKNNDIDYYKLSDYRCTIFNDLLNNEKFEFSDNSYQNFNEMMKVEEHYNNGFIIHEKIIGLIFGKITPYSDNFREKNIKVIGCYIYIIDKSNVKSIYIGTLNENLTFNIIYVIEYSSSTISDKESKNLLFTKPIEEYLKLRKCYLTKKKKYDAKLYDNKDNTEIGTILIFGEKLTGNEQSKLYNKKLITSEIQKEASNIDFKELSKKIFNIQIELKSKDENLLKITNEMNNLIKEKELLMKSNEQKEKEINSLKNAKTEEFNNIIKKYEEISNKYNNLKKEQGEKEQNLFKEKSILENKYQDLEKSLKEKNIENILLKEKFYKIEKNLNEKQSLNDEYKAKLLNCENSLKEYRNKLQEIENKHKLEINILEKNNETTDKKNKETENIILLKDEEISQLKNDNIKMKTEIENKEKELSKANMELNESLKNADELKNNIDKLNEKISKQEGEIQKINQIKKNLENINNQNNITLNKYKEELEKAKNEKIENEQNLEAIMNTNDTNVKKFESEITQLKSQLFEFKKKLDEKNKENEKLLKELELKNSKLDDNKKLFEKIQSDISLEQQKYQNLQQKLNENEEQLRNSQDLINKKESDLNGYKSLYDELNKKYKKSMEDKEAQINDIINSYSNQIQKIKEESINKNTEKENLNKELIKIKQMNNQLISKSNELNNIIQIKNKEINNLKNILEENKSNQISESEFQKILIINDELIEKNKKLEIKDKESMNMINYYRNNEKEYERMKNENNQIKNNNKNELNQLEEKKNKLNEEILDLTLKLSELEKDVIEKKNEYEKIRAEINKDREINSQNHLIIDRPPQILPKGLNNVGATCFMNSTLQCLSQTKKLTDYFLNPQNKERIIKNNIALKNPDDLQLSPLYLELISKLWAKDSSKNYSPYNFMNCVQSMNPLFQRGQAGDAKDFIIFLLEQMHSELKKNMKKNVQLPPLNQYAQKNAIQHFFMEFQEELSVFSDLFFGFNETTNICYNCKHSYGSKGQAYPICYNYGIFNCIIFPLEEVKKMKNNFMQSMQNNMGMGFNNNMNFSINNNRVNLNDCFIYNQKTDKFTGENQNYCNICRKMADSDYTSRIYVSPNVLILILNRGKNNIYNVKLDFSLDIDITNFVILKDKPKVTYNLYGVITHLGESGPNAHFIASCKSPIDSLWYRFNDGLVYRINDFQKEIHDFGNPYILFYQKYE